MFFVGHIPLVMESYGKRTLTVQSTDRHMGLTDQILVRYIGRCFGRFVLNTYYIAKH